MERQTNSKKGMRARFPKQKRSGVGDSMTEQRTTSGEKLITLDNHLRHRSDCDAGLAAILNEIAFAGKIIQNKVRRARIADVVGAVENVNVQGEQQQKLDVFSNAVLIDCLSNCAAVGVIASEEEEQALILERRKGDGEYGVLFDPLDGSSNIDFAVGVGTIFSILRNVGVDASTQAAILQPGTQQVAAGYILYGSSVLLVLTLGDGVDMYVLDPATGSFLLVQEKVSIPTAKKIYSINEAYRNDFPKGYQDYLDFAHASGYAARYIGSMVADVHRTLLKGGVFLYPPTKKNPQGKLRLLYEANPMAQIIEQAGGKALVGKTRLLEVKPEKVHQRTAVILGSSQEVDAVARHL